MDFRRLHESGCFVIPNPWDVGSARFLAHLGFPALATSSAGFGFSRGKPDSVLALGLDEVLAHAREIVGATSLPVNCDFQNGYADEPERVAENVRRCAATGVAGLSIEDATGDAARPLYELPLAVERVRAAKAALAGTEVLLTARAECFLVKHPDALRESIRRLQAYAEAGADVLYAPGALTKEQVREIVSSAAPKPVNILCGSPDSPTVPELAALGVRRVSVGSALARAAWGGFARAARLIINEGRFDGLDGAIPFAELNEVFRGILDS
jgi:2-methylisocitrate lyase-like PEP mutase family enzyme